MKLKPFDLNAVCPKCGSADIGTTYHKEHHYLRPCWLTNVGEHLCRLCHRCSYEWIEDCLKQLEGVK